jgi:hypothetical protein
MRVCALKRASADDLNAAADVRRKGGVPNFGRSNDLPTREVTGALRESIMDMLLYYNDFRSMFSTCKDSS